MPENKNDFFFNFLSLHSIKMKQKVLIFGKENSNKNAFLRYKRSITISKAEINKIVWSKKDLYGNKGAFKYFTGYISNAGIIPLQIHNFSSNEHIC